MTTTSASRGRDGLDSICMSGALIGRDSGECRIVTEALRHARRGHQLLDGISCGLLPSVQAIIVRNVSLAAHLVGVETDTHSPQSDRRPLVEQGMHRPD